MDRTSSKSERERSNGDVAEEEVWDQLRTVYDPEIPVNIVDLGLVYDCQVTKSPETGTRVDVKMTLTAPGSGRVSAIDHDSKLKILSISWVDEASVELVCDLPWNQ